MSGGPALVALTGKGAGTARRLQTAMGAGELHALARRVAEADIAFDDTVSHLQALFAAGRPIVGFCAAGILIRALAPLLADKRAEPPVVAVAEDGASAVPLLGGHRGANDLAREIATALGGAAALTTAADARFDLALDAPPAGWRVADPAPAKAVTAALLAGEDVALRVEAGDPAWLTRGGARFTETGETAIRVTDRAAPGRPGELVLHPATLALGVGSERGASPEALRALVDETLAREGFAMGSIACVTSLDLKAGEPAVLALAESLGVPARFFDAERLETETPRLANPSDVVFRAVGCHGVAEAAALAAAGPSAVLVVPKQRGDRATMALARAADVIDPTMVGRARGHLAIIGIGPGHEVWRTGEAGHWLADAEDVVGYSLYLDLVADEISAAARHDFPIGAERARVDHALDLAAAGRRVALVSSGDAGIYAMAGLVFERIDRGGRDGWRRVAVEVTPGISALQAAAARIGAPLGHDFCAISLSDLLTPWPVIRERLKAAARADFVVALYNPASRTRRNGLAEALAILAAERSAETPVVVARNLGREGEAVEAVPLAGLDPDRVDMLTLLIVGNRETRRMTTEDGRSRVYTPRGYGAGGAP